jgi:hypothetical protein
MQGEVLPGNKKELNNLALEKVSSQTCTIFYFLKNSVITSPDPSCASILLMFEIVEAGSRVFTKVS